MGKRGSLAMERLNYVTNSEVSYAKEGSSDYVNTIQDKQQGNEKNQDQKQSGDKKQSNNQNKENNQNQALEMEKQKKEVEKLKDEKINEYGQATLDKNNRNAKIQLLTIIGEVEGHEALVAQHKATKYEHILPQLATVEDSNEVDGVLIMINTVGGDVEAGLAIAEMIASLSKPTVSLVLGGSHSIGVPLATSSDYSFIVPTATMIIHPVRMNGMVIGVRQTYEYLDMIQERILSFVVNHSRISYEELKGLMLNTTQLVKDVGSVLVGKEAVERGVIDEIGGIDVALKKLYSMIEETKKPEN